MNNAKGDFIDALTYQVKEEVVGNYLRERRLLEEEVNEYQWTLEAYRVLENDARELRGHLACLLVAPQNFKKFFNLLGFPQPPLGRLGHGSNLGRPPYCPLGLTPRGFTKRGRYIRLTLEVYGRLADKTAQARQSAEDIFALAGEVNNDIKKFQLNYDLMSIINFLRSLDLEMMVKKKFLGDNFSAAELGALEKSMMFRRLKPNEDGVR
ncbi:MAG: hypothetical protein AB1896_12250, partial [Thermodesulfobacteriota bacterium]